MLRHPAVVSFIMISIEFHLHTTEQVSAGNAHIVELVDQCLGSDPLRQQQMLPQPFQLLHHGDDGVQVILVLIAAAFGDPQSHDMEAHERLVPDAGAILPVWRQHLEEDSPELHDAEALHSKSDHPHFGKNQELVLLLVLLAVLLNVRLREPLLQVRPF